MNWGEGPVCRAFFMDMGEGPGDEAKDGYKKYSCRRIGFISLILRTKVKTWYTC